MKKPYLTEICIAYFFLVVKLNNNLKFLIKNQYIINYFSKK